MKHTFWLAVVAMAGLGVLVGLVSSSTAIQHTKALEALEEQAHYW